MGVLPKLLIDVEVEGQNKQVAYCLQSIGDEESETVLAELAGKNIVTLCKREENLEIYKLLEENCDIIFCTTQKLDDFHFYPVPRFSIFAVDSEGNCFGTIGGIGDIRDDDYPVGYVNQEGVHSKISNSLKEFLELITFHPHWRDIIRYEQIEASYDINAIKMKKIENDPQYLRRQRKISQILKLSNNPKSIELLISNIKSPPEFEVYKSKDEAQMTNKYIFRYSFLP